MKKYFCKCPGCNELLDTKGYCDNHTKDKPKPFQTALRSNNYNDYQWRKLRKKMIEENPYCCICGNGDGLDNCRLELHHIEPPRGNEALFYDENNLIVVCSNCHRKITNEEIQERKKMT